MSHATMLAASVVLSVIELAQLWLIGRKYPWAWLMLIGTQPVWAAYFVLSSQAGFVIVDAFNVGIGVTNYRRWRKNRS